jgi:hypothetical protein
VLRKYASAPVVWGKTDCLHFGLEGHAAAGNRDLRPKLPRYSTFLGASRALTRLGFPSLFEALDAFATPIRRTEARTGDIAFQVQKPIGAVGVVVGPTAFFMGDGQLRRLPLNDLFFWRAE